MVRNTVITNVKYSINDNFYSITHNVLGTIMSHSHRIVIKVVLNVMSFEVMSLSAYGRRMQLVMKTLSTSQFNMIYFNVLS